MLILLSGAIVGINVGSGVYFLSIGKRAMGAFALGCAASLAVTTVAFHAR